MEKTEEIIKRVPLVNKVPPKPRNFPPLPDLKLLFLENEEKLRGDLDRDNDANFYKQVALLAGAKSYNDDVRRSLRSSRKETEPRTKLGDSTDDGKSSDQRKLQKEPTIMPGPFLVPIDEDGDHNVSKFINKKIVDYGSERGETYEEPRRNSSKREPVMKSRNDKEDHKTKPLKSKSNDKRKIKDEESKVKIMKSREAKRQDDDERDDEMPDKSSSEEDSTDSDASIIEDDEENFNATEFEKEMAKYVKEAGGENVVKKSKKNISESSGSDHEEPDKERNKSKKLDKKKANKEDNKKSAKEDDENHSDSDPESSDKRKKHSKRREIESEEESDKDSNQSDPEPSQSSGDEDESSDNDKKEKDDVDEEVAKYKKADKLTRRTMEFFYKDKLKDLKRKLGSAMHPYDENGSFYHLYDVYKACNKGLNYKRRVENYRFMLMLSFIGIEKATGAFGLENDDYFKKQMEIMGFYDDMLYELGEKEYISILDSIPVEIRLIGAVGLNTSLFFMGKRLFGNMDILGVMMNMNKLYQAMGPGAFADMVSATQNSGNHNVKTGNVPEVNIRRPMQDGLKVNPPNMAEAIRQAKMKGPALSVNDENHY
jgi:hypothetical protein